MKECEKCGQEYNDEESVCPQCNPLSDNPDVSVPDPQAEDCPSFTEERLEESKEDKTYTEPIYSTDTQGEREAVTEEKVEAEKTEESRKEPQRPNVVFTEDEITKSKSEGMAIAGLICGIASIVLCWIAVFGIILGVLGIVFGVIGKKQNPQSGMAKAGFVCGIIGIVISVIVLIVIAVLTIAMVGLFSAMPMMFY